MIRAFLSQACRIAPVAFFATGVLVATPSLAETAKKGPSVTADDAVKDEKEGAAETLSRRITGDNGSHVVAYGTEGGLFQAAGWSTVVCGPGDIAQAHQPDEFITVAQLDAGTAFVRALITELAR